MIIQADVFGLFLLMLSLACLGTWPALLRLCSLEELRPSGTHELLPNLQTIGCCRSFYYGEQLRNMCHVYLDYSTSYFAVSSAPLLLTLALSGESNLPKMSPVLVLVAMFGGGLLSIGNLSMQWATAVYGAPLTTVLAIQASLTVLLGTSLNYMLEPYKTSRPGLLVAGVLVFLVAISLATQAQWVYAKQKEQAQQGSSSDEPQTPYTVASVLSSLSTTHSSTIGAVVSSLSSTSLEKTRQQLLSSLFLESSQSEHSDELEQERRRHLDDSSQYSRHASHDEEGSSSDDDNILDSSKRPADNRIPHAIIVNKTLVGIIVAVLGGLCFGFFSPAFNIAVNDPFQWASSSSPSFTFYFGNNTADYYPHDADAPIPRGAGDDLTDQLLVARTNLWFSFAFWITSCVGNTILLKRQAPLSSWIDLWKTYLTQDSMWDRQLAFTAGMICAVGNVLQFQGGQLVGYAAADLVQAYPIVSTVWDVFLFREFRQVRVRSYLFCELLGMYAAYLTGIGLLAGSSMMQ